MFVGPMFDVKGLYLCYTWCSPGVAFTRPVKSVVRNQKLFFLVFVGPMFDVKSVDLKDL